MKIPEKAHTLRRRFTLVSLITLLMVAVALSVLHFIITLDLARERLQSDLEHIEQSHKEAVISSLWLTDYPSLMKQLEDIVRFDYIVGVEVTDENGRLYTAGSPSTAGLDELSVDLVYRRRDSEIPVGRMRIYIHRQGLKSDIVQTEIFPFLFLCISAAILSLVLSLQFRHLVGKHLEDAAAFLKERDLRFSKEDLKLHRRREYPDELAYLVESINQMREKIRTYIQEEEDLQLRLSETNQQLEKTIREKDKFFSLLAHDLRSPFSGFLGLSRTLHDHLEDFSPEDLRETTGELKLAAEMMHTLLENLLEWSRIEQRTIKYTPEKHPVEDIIQESLDLFTGLASQKNIHLRLSIQEPIIVLADEKMVNSILRNLLSNAIKYTDEGGEVTLSVEPKNDKAEISVTDSGRGMGKKTLSALFSPVPSVSERGTRGERGSGLGLLICREFVELHGGTIRAESTPGRGTTVTFSLPVAR
ncbi:MAG: hypothetical protein JW760_05195 [Spirochaetales bacterium]|nr:hypothetical protein [Spirochaetales bacterium]